MSLFENELIPVPVIPKINETKFKRQFNEAHNLSVSVLQAQDFLLIGFAQKH